MTDALDPLSKLFAKIHPYQMMTFLKKAFWISRKSNVIFDVKILFFKDLLDI